MRIRAVARRDLSRLQDIERAAGECFRSVGMPEVADDEPFAVEDLASYADDGRGWVAVDVMDLAVGYLIVDVVDGSAHIEQVSVHPDAARQGIGRDLIEYLAGVDRGYQAITLTTFVDVPWNAPYYARLGFRPLADAELTPGLREIRRCEAAHGLDRWHRICMRRDLRVNGSDGRVNGWDRRAG